MINKRLPNVFRTINALLTVIAGGLLTTLASAQIPTLPQQPISPDIAQAINSVMAVSYGSDYDKLRGCTLYHRKKTFDNEDSEYVPKNSYCIAPIKYQIEEVNGETRLYLLTSSYVYNGNTSRANPGMGGLFELYKLGNSWVLSASDPFIYSGGSGRSQLYQFALSKVGDDRYGWTGKHCGSGAGGQSSCLWQMYASIDDKIKSVAEIEVDYYSELISENMYYEGTGQVAHQSSAPMTAGFYPLEVTLNNTSGRLGHYDNDLYASPESEDKSIYAYNPSKQQFELVE